MFRHHPSFPVRRLIQPLHNNWAFYPPSNYSFLTIILLGSFLWYFHTITGFYDHSCPSSPKEATPVCPSYLFNPFYLLPGLMFLFCSRVIFEQYRIGDLTSRTRELRFGDHVVRRCSVQHFRKDVLWWSSRVRGGSILPRTILGHRCGDKRWPSGTTSSSPFLSLRNLNSHEWKWNSRKGKCKHLGV